MTYATPTTAYPSAAARVLGNRERLAEVMNGGDWRQLPGLRLEAVGKAATSGVAPDVIDSARQSTAMRSEITKFATEAMGIADRRTVMDLGAVENANFIFEKTGVDVTGYKRILDNYGVRHTMKQHGDPKKEFKRGQIAVTLGDFGLIPMITSMPDSVFQDGKNKIGRDVIVFTKVIDGIGYRHVEELRGKHKLVATDSLRKKKGPW